MTNGFRNIYKIARESAGLTQEKAAELIDISVRSLRMYEYNERTPNDEVVLKMIEIYNAQYLAYQHLKTKTKVGKEHLPEIEITDLSQSVLAFLDECADLDKIEHTLIKISKDNKIDKTEIDDWNRTAKEIQDVISTGLKIIFSRKR